MAADLSLGVGTAATALTTGTARVDPDALDRANPDRTATEWVVHTYAGGGRLITSDDPE